MYCGNNPVSFADPEGRHRARFDGRSLRIEDHQGREVMSLPARSGMPGSTPLDQNVPDYGPIPEGTWSVDPKEVQRRTWNPIAAAFNDNLFWRGSHRAWGNIRVPLRSPGANVMDRGGFFIHGGWYRDSRGCLDLGPFVKVFVEWLERHVGPVTVAVRYSGPFATDLGEPWRPWRKEPQPTLRGGPRRYPAW